MTTKILSSSFNIHNALQFIESFTEDSNDNYYLFFGKHTPYLNTDATIATPVDSQRVKVQDAFNDMLFGKKISADDVYSVTFKNIWSSNTVYSMYDDIAPAKDANSTFVAVPSGSNYDVFKCLYNADGQPSSNTPASVSTSSFIEADGYMWKYMYTIPSATWNKFSSVDYMPVLANTAVQSTAIDRGIEVIIVGYTGSGYNNYTNGTFSTADQFVTTTEFKLNGDASLFNDFYTGCVIKFTLSGPVYEYRVITDYTVAGSNKTITLDAPVPGVTIGDIYEIYPGVTVYGDGTQTVNCLAWAVIDANSANSVAEIEIIRTGERYRTATASVIADASVSVTDAAELRPIISPVGGHGSDPVSELNTNKVCISVKTSNTESDNIIAANDFRNVGVIRNPEFANIKLIHEDSDYFFNVDELVYQYNPIQIVGVVSVNTASNSSLLTSVDTQFSSAISVDDVILIQNSTFNFVTTVTNVIDDINLVMEASPLIDIDSCNVSIVKVTANGIVKSYAPGELVISTSSDPFVIGKPVVGVDSHTIITTTDVLNNERTNNNFDTYMQTVKFTGALTSGTFINDELVFQGGFDVNDPFRPIGRLFHYADDVVDELYITNEFNVFTPTATIIGATSGAVFNSSDKYTGDLTKDSGDVLYLENVLAVTRSNNSAETVKIILEF